MGKKKKKVKAEGIVLTCFSNFYHFQGLGGDVLPPLTQLGAPLSESELGLGLYEAMGFMKNCGYFARICKEIFLKILAFPK